MQKMIHIGNFQKKPKVLTGRNAKMSINGKEVIRFSDANYFSGADYSIGGDISAMHVLGDFHPKEIIPPPLIEDRIVDFATSLSQDTERRENFGKPDEIYSPFRFSLKPMKIDMDSIKAEIVGNEMHVDMNWVFPNSINFIPLNIDMDHLKTQPPGGDVGPQEVLLTRDIVHIGNFNKIEDINTQVDSLVQALNSGYGLNKGSVLEIEDLDISKLEIE